MNDAFGHPQSIVVLGGTSDIARAVVRTVVPPACSSVVLAGRDSNDLRAAGTEATAAGATCVTTIQFDATDLDGVDSTVEACFAATPGDVDLVLVAVGRLGDQTHDETDSSATATVVTVNFTWPAAALSSMVDRLRQQGQGRVVVFSSVAGVRVRRANFIYGSAKAGIDAYALGLAEALRGTGVRVQVVRLGFVHTKMTSGLPSAPFAVTAEQAAAKVRIGIERNEPIIWVPGKLRWVFLVLRHLPNALWRRLPR
jgi:decaprenylphospho-beta-D-erythro-pentofuranosid-2-ulose 2-reductase